MAIFSATYTILKRLQGEQGQLLFAESKATRIQPSICPLVAVPTPQRKSNMSLADRSASRNSG